jgi:two-component system, OmpR family, heavy metal sensor histidine kinase CusS
VNAEPLGVKRDGHSISRRLSLQLAAMTLLGLGVLSGGIYWSVSALIHDKQMTNEAATVRIIDDMVKVAAVNGDEQHVIHKTQFFAPRRPSSRLELARADGTTLFRDADEPPFRLSPHVHRVRFDIATPELRGGVVRADLLIDVADDVRLLRGVLLTLVVTTLVGGALVYLLTLWRVRAGMAPLRDIVRQTRAISPKRLDQRLSLAVPVEELEPWIGQFNALLERLEAAYRQLEGFNADVAHELRTPLATLIGQTEVALSRERSADALHDILASNLEELQRLAAMVNDMLFLASADRGAQARRNAAASLAAIAWQVIEFHEAALAERNLRVAVRGDATVPVDEPLFKRAISNLLGNAVRFADPGSEITVQIGADGPGEVRVLVQNHGVEIEPAHLPRLFDRFFRAESSRASEGQAHHGLGLSIVAAIARMHSGRTFARSNGGVTALGFTLSAS